jgi:hypothetical protein
MVTAPAFVLANSIVPATIAAVSVCLIIASPSGVM